LTILFLFCIMIIGFGESVFPGLMTASVKTRTENRLATNDVQVSMGTDPSILLMLGQIQNLHIAANGAHIGDAKLREITMDGSNVFFDMPAFVMDHRAEVRRADKLEMRAVLDADSLKDLLMKKVDRLENVSVTIDKDGVHVKANAKIFGKTADIAMDGVIVEDLGNLYFNMTRLSVTGAHIGKADFGEMFGNIRMAAADKMPFGLKITQVQQTDGAVIVTAALPESR